MRILLNGFLDSANQTNPANIVDPGTSIAGSLTQIKRHALLAMRCSDLALSTPRQQSLQLSWILYMSCRRTPLSKEDLSRGSLL
jgi:hypothetical protein